MKAREFGTDFDLLKECKECLVDTRKNEVLLK